MSAVDHPAHYNAHPSGIECIDVVETLGFNLGNAVKYLWRAGLKDDALADLRKAEWYLRRCETHGVDPEAADETEAQLKLLDYYEDFGYYSSTDGIIEGLLSESGVVDWDDQLTEALVSLATLIEEASLVESDNA